MHIFSQVSRIQQKVNKKEADEISQLAFHWRHFHKYISYKHRNRHDSSSNKFFSLRFSPRLLWLGDFEFGHRPFPPEVLTIKLAREFTSNVSRKSTSPAAMSALISCGPASPNLSKIIEATLPPAPRSTCQLIW